MKFQKDKLDYLNQQHLKAKFDYFDQLEMKKCVMSFRKMLLENYPEEDHALIKKTSEPKLKKIMDLLKGNFQLSNGLLHHKYFFIEPTYSDPNKLLKRLTQINSEKCTILADLKKSLSKIEDE